MPFVVKRSLQAVALTAIMPAFVAAQEPARPDSAQPLPATTVSADKPAPHLVAFEERRAKKRGRYITPAELREAHDRKLLEMLERLPGLSAQASSNGYAVLAARSGPNSFVEKDQKGYDYIVKGKAPAAQSSRTFRSNEGGLKPGYCAVAVFIDGMYIPEPDVGSLRTTGFDAVEWYTAANVPPEFKRPGVDCGAVLLWSR
jgi:hypothetical protein